MNIDIRRQQLNKRYGLLHNHSSYMRYEQSRFYSYLLQIQMKLHNRDQLLQQQYVYLK